MPQFKHEFIAQLTELELTSSQLELQIGSCMQFETAFIAVTGIDVVRQRSSPTQEGEQDAVVDLTGRARPETT